MKKNFRKGRGSESKSSQSHGNAHGKSQAGESKGKGKPRRDIKNARSLSDVLGVSSKPSTHRNKNASEDRGQHRDHNRDQGRADAGRPSASGGATSKGPQSKKLTYIMNFQPPGGAPPTEGRPEPTVDTPRRFSGAASTAMEPGPEHEFNDLHSRKDFKWPKGRADKLEYQVEEERRASRGHGDRVAGIVKRHPDGFGFLIPDDSTHPDVYISRQSMTGVMTNDRVEVQVYRPKSANKHREDRLAGEITKVISRANKRVVGKFLPVDQKYGVILDDNRGWGADLRVAMRDAMSAKEGDMVVVEITQYPNEDREFTGKVIDRLGSIDDPMNDVMRVVYQSNIPTEFSAAALSEARRFGGVVTEQETKGREDVTQIPLITIDGVTAKDFDDAVYTEQTAHGFRLLVAIADVSHYVKPGTPLDHEAYERGTSTYFPNFVVPMLPEELSNELCSLKPEVRRLCFCCEMNLNFNGEIEKFRFFEGVMQSKARVTYGEAQEVIDGATPPRLRHVADNILRSADLAKILMQKRFREGSLDLEIPETQVVVDSTGESTDIIKSQRLFAHRLIEELMLVTNICTARFLDDHQIPGIYRIHEEPDPDNIKALQRYLWNLGGSRSVMGGQLQKKLSKALQSMVGKPEAQVLNILTLRTMRQAQYSSDNVGHFGLGFSHYSHFTSPIRRYPDLIAHRLIKSQIYPRYRSMQMTESELASASTFLSACEQRSVKAERQVISIKKARFIRRFLGQEFEGIISSVAKFGVFVLLRQYDVDGLVKIENLGRDRFTFDEENLRLIGNRTGLRYTIGDVVKVRVANADPEQGRIDFELAEPIQVPEDTDEDDSDFDFERDFEERPSERRRDDRDNHHRAKGSKHGARQRKSKGLHAEKRRSSEDDRRGVRKERVSKRRRKN